MSGVPVERLPDEADEIAGHIRRGEVYTAHLDALGERILPGLAAEIRRLRALLADAAGYLAVTHRHAGQHDVLGVNLGCAGCALLDRIERDSEPRSATGPRLAPGDAHSDAEARQTHSEGDCSSEESSGRLRPAGDVEDDSDPDVCPDCFGIGYDIGGPEHCTTCRGTGQPAPVGPCAHCGKPRIGLGGIGGAKVCHTGTLPPQADPIDCYRLVTVYREPLGARIEAP